MKRRQQRRPVGKLLPRRVAADLRVGSSTRFPPRSSSQSSFSFIPPLLFLPTPNSVSLFRSTRQMFTQARSLAVCWSELDSHGRLIDVDISWNGHKRPNCFWFLTRSWFFFSFVLSVLNLPLNSLFLSVSEENLWGQTWCMSFKWRTTPSTMRPQTLLAAEAALGMLIGTETLFFLLNRSVR